MPALPAKAWAFIALVICLSVPLVGGAAVLGASTFDWVDLVMLALLYIVSDSIGARGSRDSMTIALGVAAVYGSLRAASREGPPRYPAPPAGFAVSAIPAAAGAGGRSSA